MSCASHISIEPNYHVVHIVNPEKFFVRNASDQMKFESLCKSLQKMPLKPQKEEKYDALTKALQKMELHPVVKPKRGAIKRHGNVYRCEILEHREKYAEVKLIDTGEIVAVSRDSVYHLAEKYTEMSPLVTECCFLDLKPYSKDIGWTETSRKIFADEVRNKTFSLKIFDTSEPVLKVDLIQGEKISVRDHLISTKCGVFPNPKKLKHRKSLEKPIMLEFGRCHRVVVTWAQSPDEISVIEGQNFNHLKTLEKKLQKEYSKANAPQWNSSMGCFLIAKVDDRYHRAKILASLTDELHEVEIIDWGRIKFLNLSQMLEVIDREFFREPPLSHKFALFNVKPMSPKYHWSRECMESLRKLCEGKTGLMNIVDEHHMRLSVDEVSVNEWLVQKKYGKWKDEKANEVLK